MAGRFTFVSVVFETEVPLLRLQARSFARFVPPELLESVVVIDNSARGIRRKERSRLLDEFGALSPRVRVLRPADVCALPRAIGWWSQQVLKLKVAEQVSTERYVVLDAKNHFVAAADVGSFQAPDGRPRVNTYSFEEHPLRPRLEGVLDYLGLDPEKHLGRFTATVTPFVLDTRTVVAMMADVERRSGRSFASELVAAQLTEFFLYTGWLLSRGHALDEVFDDHQRFTPTVWPGRADATGVRAAVEQADRNGTPLFGVHRRALVRLDPEAVDLLAGFWADRGLFGSPAEASDFITAFRRGYARRNRGKQLRELPLRLATDVRRARRE